MGIPNWESPIRNSQLNKSTFFNFCKNAKANSGVEDAKFYWQNPNVVAIIVEHDGSWGPNIEPSGQTMKAFFDLADLSTCTMDEPWIEAGLGHKRTQKISS